VIVPDPSSPEAVLPLQAAPGLTVGFLIARPLNPHLLLPRTQSGLDSTDG